MPAGQFVSFGVYTNGSKLPEYKITDKVYTEVNLLHGPNSYVIEEDEQVNKFREYPVLPFSVNIKRECYDVVWIKVLLDGQVISSRPLINKFFCCDGVKVGNEIRELLFSLPRVIEDQEKKNPLGKHSGTIRMVVTETRCLGEKHVPVLRFQKTFDTHWNKDLSKLYHLTKKDVQQYKTDAMGCIVSREGRPSMNMMPTGQLRRLKKFVQTGNILEELVLYYRPHVSSHTPNRPAVKVIKQEKGADAEERQSRTPLCDIRNVLVQQSDEKNLPESDTAMPQEGIGGVSQQSAVRGQNDNSQLSDHVGEQHTVSHTQDTRNVVMQPSPVENISGESQQSQSSGGADPMETDHANDKTSVEESQNHSGFTGDSHLQVARRSSLIALKKVKHRGSYASAAIPPGQVENHDGGDAALIPPEKMKHRDSCPSAMIPPEQDSSASTLISAEQIKRRDSDASKLIPPGQIKSRKSDAATLIPLQQIMHEDSSASPLIPPEQIKRRASDASTLIPPQQIKSRKSDASTLIPPQQIKSRKSDASTLIPPGQIKSRKSDASTLIPPGQIKSRKSDASTLILSQQIKHRDSDASTLIPPGQIKSRKSDASTLIPPGQIKSRKSDASTLILPERIKRRDSCNSASTPSEEMKCQESLQPDIASDSLIESFVLIDDSDEEDDVICVYDVDDDSFLFIGGEDEEMATCEDLEGDSIICMGDDECHILDVSDHESIVEIDDVSDTQ